MGANSFGERFRITTFGESHGVGLGVVIDGCPSGVAWQEDVLLRELERRRPGSGGSAGRPSLVSDRNEGDGHEVLSGVHGGFTLGTPIAMLVRNQDARSQDYREITEKPRPGHADDVWRAKFGVSDPRGGGRSSGRETVARVMAGAVAQMFLAEVATGLRVTGFMRSAGPLCLGEAEVDAFDARVRADLGRRGSYPADAFAGRFPSEARQRALEELLLDAKRSGKSHGGVAEIWIDGCPEHLGQPVFRKLKSDLAAAFMSVGATCAVELGSGIDAASAEGSSFHAEGAEQGRYGGIRGGISTGERIRLKVHFKPTSSVLDVAKRGRHDPCIVPRAVPVLEAMAYLVIADHLLWARGDRAEALALRD